MNNPELLTQSHMAILGLVKRKGVEFVKLNHNESYRLLVKRHLIKENGEKKMQVLPKG